MKKINKLLFISTLLLFITSVSYGQKRLEKLADEDTAEWRYEIECVGTGNNGAILVKVWTYSRKPEVAMEQAKKNAVHGVIFKGIPQGDRGCFSQPALSRSANLEQEKQGFFGEFFRNGGKYMKFVNLATDGAIATGDRVKIGRKEYKIAVIVSVNKDLLRDELEDAGIIRGLSSGF